MESDDSEPAEIDGDELLRAVQRVAVATLLARHWPVEGSRHVAAQISAVFLSVPVLMRMRSS